MRPSSTCTLMCAPAVNGGSAAPAASTSSKHLTSIASSTILRTRTLSVFESDTTGERRRRKKLAKPV